ncbi:IBR domain-containing protein [Xylariaceae sp. FL1272]|nr:IBR domain-containing protein [Xylariaceae sp. FL1272]
MAVSVQSLSFLVRTQGVDNALPEVRESEYQTEVLRPSADGPNAYLGELMMRAANLGISLARTSTDDVSATDKRNTLGVESNITFDTSHTRTVSTGSHDSVSTTLTSHSSSDGHDFTGKFLARRRSRGLSFTQYNTYLTQIEPKPGQQKLSSFTSAADFNPAPSLFSVTTRKSYASIKKTIFRMRGRRRTSPDEPLIFSCSACRDDLQPDEELQKLPCGHGYCPTCLRIMINQATTEESKMPPRCCTQPMPGLMIKSILSREEQNQFLKAVLQFSTPWESRVFCSNPSCGDFIPPRNKIDPRHPFEAECRKCRTRVCIVCKRNAHPLGQDCPDDKELEAVLTMGEKSGWRRCYKCRTLVELTQGCTHMTCRCKAQFCYICGAVWDPTVGCPNFCNGDAEMDRRRQEEEERLAALEAEEAAKREAAAKEEAERLEAEERTGKSDEFKAMRAEQSQEMDRCQTFERKSRWLLWTRHAQQKIGLVEKHTAAIEKMQDRHTKTAGNLEDRQVAAEMELRTTLEQSERNVRIRLKHMEAYCDGLGHNPSSHMPSRVVTERDLRELGQQYNLEKNMKQLHQAKVNVMRDRQAKALEELLERQESEMSRLTEKNAREIEQMELGFADEEEHLAITFRLRRKTLETRWALEAEIMRRELENERGVKYAVVPPLDWPPERDALEEALTAVDLT